MVLLTHLPCAGAALNSAAQRCHCRRRICTVRVLDVSVHTPRCCAWGDPHRLKPEWVRATIRGDCERLKDLSEVVAHAVRRTQSTLEKHTAALWEVVVEKRLACRGAVRVVLTEETLQVGAKATLEQLVVAPELVAP